MSWWRRDDEKTPAQLHQDAEVSSDDDQRPETEEELITRFKTLFFALQAYLEQSEQYFTCGTLQLNDRATQTNFLV